MSQIKLSKRLSAVATYVRDGALVADIGTDHAYLPIFLIESGKAKLAVASDINEGPIMRAGENVEAHALGDKIITRIADGLDGIEQYKPSDILICGMGGELISQIIDKCDYLKNDRINLILQPMTSVVELRSYLSNGFCVFEEDIVFEDGKYYQIICAKYDGKKHDYSALELEVGKRNIEKRSSCFCDFVSFLISKKKRISEGMRQGACSTDEIDNLIKELEGLK